MEVMFEKNSVSCLDTAIQEVQNSEQSQQIKLPDSLPDIGRVVTAWGQSVLRSKEWQGDSLSVSCGMMVWVLFLPEDGSAERCIEAWIPFQMQWDLPEGLPEGTIRVQCMPRFVDARSVSARKIMVRAGMSAFVQAFVPKSVDIYALDSAPEGVEILRSTYPVRMPGEAGEKTFLMDEDLELPDAAPKPEKLICYRMNPRITDKKVLSDKVVFRGNGNLHTLFRSEEGQLHSWDFELPFSQFDQLDTEHDASAQADIQLMPTSLELDLDEEGHLRLKSGIVAQYVVSDQKLLNVIEDAYAPGRELQLQREEAELPAILEARRENLYGEQTISQDANVTADVSFLPEFPRQRRQDDGVSVEYPGQFQVLYYGEDGALQSSMARWEGRQSIPADENTTLTVLPNPGETQATAGSGQILMKTELPVEMMATARQRIPMVAGLELGQQSQRDPGRPSLILRRAGEQRLWDIAKESGSTVAAIRRANALQEEAAPGQMLLIPVS